MPIDNVYEKAMLDWLLGANSPSSTPPGRWLQFATASPDANNAFDGPLSPRCTVSFAAANSPAGSKTSLNAISCTATAIASIRGWNIYDRSVGGTRLCYGTSTSVIGCASADIASFAAGALTITLA